MVSKNVDCRNVSVRIKCGTILFHMSSALCSYFLADPLHPLGYHAVCRYFQCVLLDCGEQGLARNKKNRFKLGFIGSSFYLILTIVFIYGFMSLKPAYPGEDTFMSAIGLVFAIIVTAIAFIACLVYTGFSGKAMDRK